ncbi:MAG: hypothetical protein QF437_09185 [Planctomycetota bacterium]|nr:hypothetical protein [Planctomycetota bacterium]
MPLSTWPADERGLFKDPAEVAKTSLQPFAALLIRGADGKPQAGSVKLYGVPFEIGYPNSLLAITPAALAPRSFAVFANGRTRYYGIMLGRGSGEAMVTLPQKAHTYDVRAGRYLGDVDGFTDTFDRA